MYTAPSVAVDFPPMAPLYTRPNTELTSVEKTALAFYRAHVEQHDKAPTVRALAEHLDMYPSAAQKVLVRLSDKGYLAFRQEVQRVTRTRLTLKGKKVPL